MSDGPKHVGHFLRNIIDRMERQQEGKEKPDTADRRVVMPDGSQKRGHHREFEGGV